MVPLQRLFEPRQELLALLLVQLIDHFRERPDRENALPPRHRVCPDNRVHCLQRPSDILRASARLLVDLDFLRVGLRHLDEAVPYEGGGQTLEELLIRRGKAVVELAARSPERVAARGGELGQAERGVVGGHGLELDVRVPLRGVVALLRLVGGDLVLVDLLARLGADDADLGVAGDAKLGGVVQDRVDVQGRV